MKVEKRALGRGLSSLVGGIVSEDPPERVLQIPLDEIRPNHRQPRQQWDDETLRELSDSIRANGVLQPLIVRGRPGAYELVAGERRLRASRLAGLTHVPAVFRETDEEGMLRLALIENLQREDISPLDAALAYQNLMDSFHMTQDDVANTVGKSRSVVANAVRLLRLPQEMQESLRRSAITEGHARALVAIQDPDIQGRLWRLCESGASVREIEAAARDAREPTDQPPGRPATRLQTTVRQDRLPSPHLDALVDELRRSLGVKVEIRGDEHRGLLVLEYYSEDDLQSMADRLLAP